MYSEKQYKINDVLDVTRKLYKIVKKNLVTESNKDIIDVCKEYEQKLLEIDEGYKTFLRKYGQEIIFKTIIEDEEIQKHKNNSEVDKQINEFPVQLRRI